MNITLALSAFQSLAQLLIEARANGSLTDAQLQTAALSEDSDTRNHAAAFIAQLEGKQ
jgi:hypothetical protein